ncbi:MAG TPA: 3'-5' exonuclease [Promineifilum sp.]|nr:3'-5' exonuclease [Promineifilum sp.]
MTWLITHKPAYLSDFMDLPRDLRNHVTAALRELERDPLTLRGDTIKKLRGYENVYRYRLGDFRLIYAVAARAQVLNLLAIGPRGNIYRRFNYSGWDVPGAAATFDPELAQLQEWEEHPEWFGGVLLPRPLSPELLARWRVPAEHHAALMACRTEEELLGATDRGVPTDVVERVMNGLFPPAAAQLAAQPDLALFDPEDLVRYAEGTLAGFLLRLDESQKPLQHWALRGPTLVKGGPGSGKSTVALYRVRAVVEHHQQTTGRLPTVLFTTYTNSLTHASESLLRQLLTGLVPLAHDGKLPKEIRVSTLHKTAAWIANTGGTVTVATPADQQEALRVARSAFGRALFGEAERARVGALTADLRDDYLLEEFEWAIEGQDCRDEAAYLAADRAGRGIPFGRERRAAVWQLYEVYRDYLRDRGLCAWGQLTQLAIDRVRSGAFTRRWDYVIVDEAQDLRPAALALAVELCREPGGVFLTADANQSLYHRGFRWNRIHAALQVVGRTRMLTRNYRSTRQIAVAAAEILSGPDADEEAVRQEYIHSGPRPVVYAAPNTTAMWRWIFERIVGAARELRLPANAAAVLVPSHDVGELVAGALRDHRLPAQFMNSQTFDPDAPGVKVTTLHAAKGLEFPIVVVAHVEAGRLPRETPATGPDEVAAFLEEQRRLLYVGCTRAMRRLYVTFDQAMPSPFVTGLGEERWEWWRTADGRQTAADGQPPTTAPRPY